jgi:hypothetical protein
VKNLQNSVDFSPKTPFREALAFLREKQLLPTSLSSQELQKLDADIRARALFSARTTNAGYLQEVKNQLDDLLQGKVNEATARAKLQDMLDALSYTPGKHFGGPEDENIPPAAPGSLRDLSSDRRIKLLLETQERQAANYGYMLQGQSDIARWQYPAWEFVRIYPRADERKNWPQRWMDAGGQFYAAGRMIAPKDDPVWENLGDSSKFDDGLDTPYPPFAFNSGMGVREVLRDECIALGVIQPDYTPEFNDPGFLAGLKVQADQFAPEFLSELQAELNATVSDGFLQIKS